MRRRFGPGHLPRLPGQVRWAVSQSDYVPAGGLVKRMGPAGHALRMFFAVCPPLGAVEMNGKRYYPAGVLLPREESHGEFWERAENMVRHHRPGASWDEVTAVMVAWRLTDCPRLPDGPVHPRRAYEARRRLSAFLALM